MRLFILALISQTTPQPVSTTAQMVHQSVSPRWVRGQPVKLMVLREVNSRQVKPGDVFPLRVNSPVVIDGAIAIPVGAMAWGKVIAAAGTGVAGGRGRVSMRLMRIDTPSGPVALTGTTGAEGRENTAGVVLGVLSFGLGGLLMKGGNATLKAGDIVTSYIDEGTTPISPALVVAP